MRAQIWPRLRLGHDWHSFCRAFISLFAVFVECCGDVPTIDTKALPAGRVGQRYQVKLEASGPEQLVWVLADGRLPAGLALSRLGQILGTPEESGRFEFVVEAATSAGIADRQNLVLPVGEGRPLTLHTTQLSDAVVGTRYHARLEASGGVPPYRWTVTSGALPTGLAFAADRAEAGLLGVPREIGSFAFALEVRDDRDASVTRQITLRVLPGRRPLRSTPERPPVSRRDSERPAAAPLSKIRLPPRIRLPRGEVGVTYSATVSSLRSPRPLRQFRLIQGSLPKGLLLSDARIVGVPQEAGDFSAVVQVTEGAQSATSALSLRVRDAFKILEEPLEEGEVGMAFRGSAGVTRTQLLKFSVEGLPTGLSARFLNGRIVLAGTPRAAGSYPLQLQVEAPNGETAFASRTLTIHPRLRVSTSTIAQVRRGKAFSLALTATGGKPGPRRWRLQQGRLPPGIEVRPDGYLTGTATVAGRHAVTIAVAGTRTNGTQTGGTQTRGTQTATRAFVLEVR